MKKIKTSKRGLTFSLDNDNLIGQKFNYFLDIKNKEILIIPTEDNNGKSTFSRKKCGKKWKPLVDLRSKKVKELIRYADYLQIEEKEERILVHIYQNVKNLQIEKKAEIIRIEDIFAMKKAEIELPKAAGGEYICSEAVCHDIQSVISNNGYTPPSREKIERIYNIASFFSGAGMLDYAFKKHAHFRFVYANDFDQDASLSYKQNIGITVSCKDIRKVTENEVPECDVILSGTCCQAFSSENTHNSNTKEGEQKRLLFKEVFRLLKKTTKVIVLENVPQILSREGGKYLEMIKESLEHFTFSCKVVTDSLLGGYTNRKRAIIIGSCIGEPDMSIPNCSEVHTVRDALSKVTPSWYNYNDISKPSESSLEIMNYVPSGGNWRDVPESIRKFGPHTHSCIYRRLEWDKPSPTIIGWRKSQMLHPEENRILSVAEAAALQGMDKDFKVLGRLGSRQQQIANGVPRAVGNWVAHMVYQLLERNKTQ